jgi:hypothetical protein
VREGIEASCELSKFYVQQQESVGGDNGVAFDKVGVILSLFFHGVGQAT